MVSMNFVSSNLINVCVFTLIVFDESKQYNMLCCNWGNNMLCCNWGKNIRLICCFASMMALIILTSHSNKTTNKQKQKTNINPISQSMLQLINHHNSINNNTTIKVSKSSLDGCYNPPRIWCHFHRNTIHMDISTDSLYRLLNQCV